MPVIARNRLLAAGMFFAFALAHADPCPCAPRYPERPVTMLVGLAAGGANDLIARALAEATKAYFPQPITIINKPAGGGSLATAELVQARADGYTLIMGYGPAFTFQPYLTPHLPYKGPKDFSMVTGVAIVPLIIAGRSDAPWKGMQEFLDYAKKNPGKIRLGTGGIGSLGHIVGEDLKQAAQVDITLVPFSGAATAITAMLGGHVEAVHSNPSPLMGHLRAGTIRNLAIYEEKRVARFPDVPTLRELSYDVVTRGSYYFVAGPKGLPGELIQTLHNAFSKALRSEKFQKFAQDNVLIVDSKGPEDLRQRLEADYSFYGEFVKRVKVQ